MNQSERVMNSILAMNPAIRHYGNPGHVFDDNGEGSCLMCSCPINDHYFVLEQDLPPKPVTVNEIWWSSVDDTVYEREYRD